MDQEFSLRFCVNETERSDAREIVLEGNDGFTPYPGRGLTPVKRLR